MRMAAFRLMTFDVNYTIIKVKGSPGKQYAKIAETCGISVKADSLDKVYRPVWKVMKRDLPNYGVNQGITSSEWWAEFVARIFVSAGVFRDHTTMAALADKLYSHFKSKNSWEVYPNSHRILQMVKDKGIHMGVISNFDERLNAILTDLDLIKFFDFTLTSTDVKCEKPNPKIFQEALRISQISAEEVVHIGDDISNDYFGAQKVGITPLLLDRHEHFNPKEYPDIDQNYVIKRLSELERFL